MTRQTARSVDAALSGAYASPSGDRAASQRTNAVAELPQRSPRFPDTAWGRLRGERGWSLRELSARSLVNTAELSRIEHGIGPSPDHAQMLLAAYGRLAPEPARRIVTGDER